MERSKGRHRIREQGIWETHVIDVSAWNQAPCIYIRHFTNWDIASAPSLKKYFCKFFKNFIQCIWSYLFPLIIPRSLQLHALYITYWAQSIFFVSSWVCGFYWIMVEQSGVIPLTKMAPSSSSGHHLFTVPHLGVGTCEPFFLHVRMPAGWILCRQSRMLWTLECRSPIVSRGCHFTLVLPDLWSSNLSIPPSIMLCEP